MGSLMKAFIFLILFSSISLNIEAFEVNCPTTRCSHGGPDIQYPFRAKGQQPQHCGYPGYELVCKGNTTVIEFPSFGELIVKSISYENNRLNLLDTKNCVSDVFLNLNLSSTPFHYYFTVMNYTYLNCSKEISPIFYRIPYNSLQQVPCQSSFDYHVYIIESSLALAAMPVSCTPVKTVAIPFGYSPYLYGDSFGLALSWNMPGCTGCEAREGYYSSKSHKGFTNQHLIIVLSISFFAFMVAILISIKAYCSWKLDRQKEIEDQQKIEKFSENNKTIKPTKVQISC